MGLGPIRDTVGNAIPVFKKVFELFTGGFHFTRNDNVELPAGCLLNVNEATRLATPIKLGVIHTTPTGAALPIRVFKGSLLEVGDYIAVATSGGTAGIATAISAIDTSPAGWDLISIGSGFADFGASGAATGDLLIHCATAAASGAHSSFITANTFSAFDTTVESDGQVNGIVRGTIYANRAHRGYLNNVRTRYAALLADLPDTVFISTSR